MRSLFIAVTLASGLATAAVAQTCTGLCLQQVQCPAGQTTSLSGVIYAPNGTDPLPNVLVYIPNAPVDPFVPGVSCPIPGTPPSGSPLVGATTGVDGTFTLQNVPVGTGIPIVAVSGRWRRQTTIDTSAAACTNTVVPSDSIRMPKNHNEGDIPFIAIVTGSSDSVECVLHTGKVGIDDAEFTDPGGGGRINIYKAEGSPGAVASASTPTSATLMQNPATLNSYDVLMLPCEGNAYTHAGTELSDLVGFANQGGRVYSSHYEYSWMDYANSPFDGVTNWAPNQASPTPDPGVATVNIGFSGGLQLSQWLQLVKASTTQGQIPISTLRQDMKGVIAPTQAWLTLNDTAAGNPVMQMVFDTPVGSTGNQCGRILYNEYHVENPTISSPGKIFPAECSPGTMNAQEKLLEYSLFELTNDGGAATLTPATQDFGTQAVGFNSPIQSFVWTNKSTFSANVTLLTASGDFSIVGGNPCIGVASGASCVINVVFNPTAIGARTGTLSVGSGASTLISSLTGTGIPDLSISVSALSYGSVDVGFSVSQPLIVTNAASGAVPVPAFVTTGDYSTTNNCGSSLPAGASCTVNVIFTPTTTGARPGTVIAQSATPGPPSTMTGNGIDFTMAAAPTSGTAIAGAGSSTVVTTTPLAGFSSTLSLRCSTNAPGATCSLSQGSYTSGSPVSTTVSISTTSQYTVIGYSGFGGRWLSLAAIAAGLLLWTRRRTLAPLARSGGTLLILALLLTVGSLGISGCSGKLPAQNANYTVPGTYNFTVTATDGFLVHTANYSLNVTAK